MFFTPTGKALFEVPPAPELPADPVGNLVRGNRARGTAPDAWGTAPRFNRDGDVPWSLQAAAWDALDPADEPPHAEESAA